MVSLRVFGSNGGGDFSWLINAINFAMQNNIPILNFSGSSNHDSNGNDGALRTAIMNYPGLFICAAGNSDYNNDEKKTFIWDYEWPAYPASWQLDNLISVGSSTLNDGKSSFSNYGKNTIELFALGEQVLSTYPLAKCQSSSSCQNPPYNVHYTNGYHFMDGTSMATPFVAGVAALVKSKYPNLNTQSIRSAILMGVDKVSALSNYCVTGGRLNAYNALTIASNTWSQPIFSSNTNGYGTVSASGSHGNEVPWRAFNGTMNGGSLGNGDQWSVNANSGWLQLRLNSYIVVHAIEFYNGCSTGSNRTKAAKFTGRGGAALGGSFTAPNHDLGRIVVQVNSVLTNVIQLNASSSYGNFVNASAIVIHATVPASQPPPQTWSQPTWSSNSNSHGLISASGTYSSEHPWKAYNGTMNGGSGGNGDNWSVNAKTGWLELKLDYPIYVQSIEFWGNSSGGSNRTKGAYFAGAGGVWLGGSFELANQNQAYKNINVGGYWTNIICLNITSSYGTYVGASKIIIHGAV